MAAINFNPDQKAAISVRKNTIVAAGAGSGKTSVLSERFASLLEKDQIPLESILCLTFTRKAAAEMYSRIYRRLLKSTDPTMTQKLEAFDEARILTLDAFCSTVARSACRHYGISPLFTNDEERLIELADRLSISLIMRHRSNPVLRRLIAHLSFDSIRRDLFGKLALYDIPLFRDHSFIEYADIHIAYLKKSLQTALDILSDQRAVINDLDPSTHKKIADLQTWFQNNRIPEELRDISAREEHLDRFTQWSKDRVFSLQGKHGLDEEIKTIKKHLEHCSFIIQALQEEESLYKLAPLFDEFSRDLDEAKRNEAVLSFNDVALLARRILIDRKEIRSWYKEHIKAIMIDEFQDNNSIQKDILFLLAEKQDRHTPGIPSGLDLSPDKLFFVGDEKQSIYRFRGAEVSVFRTLSRELEPETNAGNSLPLSINYRSEPELIKFFNSIFPGIFGEAKDDWEARFQALSSPPEKTAAPSACPIEIHVLYDEDSTEDEDEELSAGKVTNEALCCAQIIRKGIDSKRFQYRDYAILFRATSDQGQFERMLSRFGIPWTTPEPRGVYLDAVANDIHSFLRLLLWPNDRLAYAAVLRSPFCSLSDKTVFAILNDQDNELFPLSPNPAWFSSDAERSRYYMAQKLFLELKERATSHSSASLLSFLWYESPYRHSILANPKKSPLIAHFELLLELAHESDSAGKPLSVFLESLSASIGTSDKLKSSKEADSKTNAVTLLTIHKSKGLEYPAVIIPRCGSDGKSKSNDKPYYRHDIAGPVVNLPAEDKPKGSKTNTWLFSEAKEQEQAMELAELCRLFYVACTRAERALYLVGDIKLNAKQKQFVNQELVDDDHILDLFLCSRRDRLDSRSFYRLLALGLEADRPPHTRLFPIERHSWQSILTLERAIASSQKQSDKENRNILAHFHSSVLLSKPKSQILHRSPSLLALSEQGYTKEELLPSKAIDYILEKENLSAVFGTLCHRCIESQLDGKAHIFIEEAKKFLTEKNLTSDIAKSLIEEALEYTSNFMNSALGQKIMVATKRSLEFPFILPLEGKDHSVILFQGSMDLIFESEGFCTIIDFKTDRRKNPSRHAVQLAIYALAAPAFSPLPVQTKLVYLRNGDTVPMEPNAISREELIALAQDYCKE